jgi:protease I
MLTFRPTGARVDGNLVSAKGWPGLAAFICECLAMLGARIIHADEPVAARKTVHA